MEIAMIAPSAKHLDRIDTYLNTLRQQAGMRCVLLVDHSGQVISQQGTTTGLDTATLAALTAAEMAATREIARVIGEKRTFSQLCHDGEKWRVIVEEVKGPWLLVGVVDAGMLLGWVRLAFRRMAEQLATFLGELRQAAYEAANEKGGTIDDGFGQALAEEMEQAFDFGKSSSPRQGNPAREVSEV